MQAYIDKPFSPACWLCHNALCMWILSVEHESEHKHSFRICRVHVQQRWPV